MWYCTGRLDYHEDGSFLNNLAKEFENLLLSANAQLGSVSHLKTEGGYHLDDLI